jgi:hypothetical protein
MYVQTIASLRAQTSPSASQEYLVGGYHAVDDGGGGHFIWVPDTTPLADDGGIIIWPSLISGMQGLGYYKRLSYTPHVSVKWFGARGDGSTDDTVAIQAAINAQNNYAYQQNMVAGWFQNNPPGVPADGSATTVFFPAGIYLISNTLIVYGYYKNILGERAILKPGDLFPPASWAIDIDHAFYTTVKGLTLSGFEKGMNLNSFNLDAANVSIEGMNFSDIGDTALRIECQSSYVEINNCSWREVRLAMDLVASDKCIVDGGWLQPLSFSAPNQCAIRSNVELNLLNMCCVPPPSPYNDTASWIHRLGYTVTIERVRFGGENAGITIVTNYGQGNTWDEYSAFPGVIRIKNSMCFNAGPAVRLMAIPNGVIMEDNVRFAWTNPVIEYDESINPIGSQLQNMNGLFSIKLDNVPFPRLSEQFGNLERPATFGVQTRLLPYVRLNNGLDSYGHLRGPVYKQTGTGPFPLGYFDYGPQPLVFFGGKLSDEAIRGGYSYEVKLLNVVSGYVTEYSEYRIETSGSSGTFYVSNLVDLTGNTNAKAPYLVLDPVTNIISAGIIGNPTAQYYAEIFYEIRNLVPTVSVAI